MLGKSLDRTISHEDIITGNNEWLNIQEIVRVTFRNMQNMIQTQDRAIQNLERQLSLKASRSEIQGLFNQKLDTEEFHIEIHDLRTVIQAIRTDTSDLICANREDYINDFRKIVAELDGKAGKSEVLAQLSEAEYQRNLNCAEIKELRKELETRILVVKNQFSKDMDYSREMNLIEFDKILEGNKVMMNEIVKNKNFVEDNLQSLYGKSKNIERNLDIANEMQAKAAEDTRKMFNSSISQTNSDLMAEIQALTENHNRLARELEQVRASKADNSHVISLLQVKSDEIQLLRQEQTYQGTQLKLKALQSELEKEMKSIKDSLDITKKETHLKFEKKLSDVHEIVNTKVAYEDHGNSLSKQEEINETLCSENTVARWVLENKRTLSGNVLWDNEKINTCPDNFIWESGAECVTVAKEGCYEVCLGFFAERSPFVQIVANEQVVYSLVNRPV